MPHQLLMRDYLIENNGGLLFCEMRTGKTLGVILFLLFLRYIPILIVAPCMAMKNWHNWLIAQGFNASLISLLEGNKNKRKKELDRNCPIIIANYEMSLTYKLKGLKEWKIIIFDESYRIANISASITQYWIRGTRPEGQYRIAVTGEPAPEKALNFATQYMITRGEFMGHYSYMDYYSKHWRKCQYSGHDVPQLFTHLDDIREYVQKTAHCVTMESLGLGSKVLFNTFFFELNTKQKKLWIEVDKLQKQSKAMGNIPTMENPFKLRAMTMERLISAGMDPETHEIINRDKIDFIVDSYLENPEPIVVFSHYKAPLFELQKTLQAKGITCGLVYGGTGTASEKEEIVNQFKDGLFDIFLGQTRSVKMNYDLSRSSLSYYLSNSSSRDDRAQSEKRTTNLEKHIPVGIVDLCFNETLDSALVKKLQAKEKISYSFIDMEFESLTRRKMGD